MDYITRYFNEMKEIISRIDINQIENIIEMLKKIRNKNGRLFFLGIGGSAANASHAVNDFRKICNFEAYTPLDNMSEFSARVNDDGWENVFLGWLKNSRLGENDALFIFSVGGGNLEKNISPNLVKAIDYAKKKGAKIIGVVGRDGGYTYLKADACVIVPVVSQETITPHTESFQSVIWHLLVSHPELKVSEMKWESLK
ncbi:MAG: SIS domain-containing protein [Promethearchaeota archaeon]